MGSTPIIISKYFNTFIMTNLQVISVLQLAKYYINNTKTPQGYLRFMFRDDWHKIYSLKHLLYILLGASSIESLSQVIPAFTFKNAQLATKVIKDSKVLFELEDEINWFEKYDWDTQMIFLDWLIFHYEDRIELHKKLVLIKSIAPNGCVKFLLEQMKIDLPQISYLNAVKITHGVVGNFKKWDFYSPADEFKFLNYLIKFYE